MLYCVFRIPNILVWHSNNLIARNQYNLYEAYEKMCISVSEFYNRPTIHSLQRLVCIDQWFILNENVIGEHDFG